MHEYHSGHYRTRADTVPFPVFYILTFGSPYQLLRQYVVPPGLQNRGFGRKLGIENNKHDLPHAKRSEATYWILLTQNPWRIDDRK